MPAKRFTTHAGRCRRRSSSATRSSNTAIRRFLARHFSRQRSLILFSNSTELFRTCLYSASTLARSLSIRRSTYSIRRQSNRSDEEPGPTKGPGSSSDVAVVGASSRVAEYLVGLFLKPDTPVAWSAEEVVLLQTTLTA